MHTPHDGGPAFPHLRWTVNGAWIGLPDGGNVHNRYVTVRNESLAAELVEIHNAALDTMLRARAAQPQEEPLSPAERQAAHFEEFGK